MTKLKSAIIILAIIATATMASAQQTYTTTGHYMAGVSKSAIQKVVKYANARDNQAIQSMISSGQAAQLRPGVKVYIESSSWGLIEIRPVGMTGTVWTVREAVE